MSDSRPVDILVNTAPPLAAVSDHPLLATEKPPVSASANPKDIDNGVPVEMTLEAKAAADAAKRGGEVKPPAKDDVTEPPKPADPDEANVPETFTPDQRQAFIKARRTARAQVNEAKEAARLAMESAEKATRELAELKATLDKRPAPDVVPDAPPPRPTRDKYDTPDAYEDALADWAVANAEHRMSVKAAQTRQEAQKAAAEAEQHAQAEGQVAARAKVIETWSEKRAAALEKYPDFETVAETSAPITPIMAEIIMRADNGPDLAYHLGKNTTEGARLAAISDVATLIFEMGKMSASIAAPPPPRAPRAKPIEPLSGRTERADTNRELTMEEYAARRFAEIRKRS